MPCDNSLTTFQRGVMMHDAAEDSWASGEYMSDTTDSLEYFMEKKSIILNNKCYVCNRKLSYKTHTIRTSFYNTSKICNSCFYIYEVFRKYVAINSRTLSVILGYMNIYASINRNFIIKKGLKTKRRGNFLKPSTIKIDWDYDKHLYNRMIKKCCYFCEKQFVKEYDLICGTNIKEIRICRDCEFLFSFMLREVKAKKITILYRIYEMIPENKEGKK